MKKLRPMILVLALMVSSNSFAGTSAPYANGYDVLIDALFLRPLGFVTTVVGSAVFVGISPLVAISSIPAPHDAFVKLADSIIVKPAKYTFIRPVGDYEYNEGL